MSFYECVIRRPDQVQVLRHSIPRFAAVVLFLACTFPLDLLAQTAAPTAPTPTEAPSSTRALDKQQSAAIAGLQLQVADAKSSADNAWMLTCSALVLMMTGPGLALFYGGLVRRKNVLATMMQSFILMAAVSVVWALVGYSLAFDTGNAFIGGLRFAFLHEVGADPCEYASTIPHTTWMVYQLMFAIITPALICG